MVYIITYNHSDEWTDNFDLRETFYCETRGELMEKIDELKMAGCYHIDVACIDNEV